MSASLPAPIVAVPGDLPRVIAERLGAAEPQPGEPATTTAAGIPFASVGWGDPTDQPLVLLHGVTASSRIWWRVGPALAASGRRVVAVDLPGHGLTGHWTGRHRFRETAADVAAWIRAARLDVPDLQIVGHSWGGMTAAALPIAGIRPATLVLLDPPAVPWSTISLMASDPSERTYSDLASGMAALSAGNPAWSAEDVRAKAEALIELDEMAARAVILDNGDWDGGLAALADPAATGVPTWIVRGDPTAGGLLPDAAVPALADLIGAEHILTLAGTPHAPQRLFPEVTTLALLRALGAP